MAVFNTQCVDSKIIVGCLDIVVDKQTWLNRSQSEDKDKVLFALDDHDQIVMIGSDHDYHGFCDLYQSQWKGIFVHKVANMVKVIGWQRVYSNVGWLALNIDLINLNVTFLWMPELEFSVCQWWIQWESRVQLFVISIIIKITIQYNHAETDTIIIIELQHKNKMITNAILFFYTTSMLKYWFQHEATFYSILYSLLDLYLPLKSKNNTFTEFSPGFLPPHVGICVRESLYPPLKI